jgi:hypothetical protein
MRSAGTVHRRASKFDFCPCRADDLAGARRRQDRELQRPRGDAVLRAQLANEGRDLGIGQRRMMLDAPHL